MKSVSKQEQIDSLIEENHSLKKDLVEENEQLWMMLDELKNSEGSAEKLVGDMLKEAIQEQLLRNMKTVGEA